MFFEFFLQHEAVLLIISALVMFSSITCKSININTIGALAYAVFCITVLVNGIVKGF